MRHRPRNVLAGAAAMLALAWSAPAGCDAQEAALRATLTIRPPAEVPALAVSTLSTASGAVPVLELGAARGWRAAVEVGGRELSSDGGLGSVRRWRLMEGDDQASDPSRSDPVPVRVVLSRAST